MTKDNKSKIAYKCIEDCLDQGMTDKVKIYDKVQKDTGLPRPTIRQSAAKLKLKLEKQIKYLESAKGYNGGRKASQKAIEKTKHVYIEYTPD